MTVKLDVMQILFAMDALNVVCVLVFALAGNFFLAVAAFLLYSVFRTASRPIWMTWLTRITDAQVRATVFSMLSQMNSLGPSHWDKSHKDIPQVLRIGL